MLSLDSDRICDIVLNNQVSSHLVFKVPFIAFYRKEYVEPELNINDLWKVWQWDEKVKLLCRRRNRLVENRCLSANNHICNNLHTKLLLINIFNQLGKCMPLLTQWLVNFYPSPTSGLNWRHASRTSPVCFRRCNPTSLSRSQLTQTNLWLTASVLWTPLTWSGMFSLDNRTYLVTTVLSKEQLQECDTILSSHDLWYTMLFTYWHSSL